MNTEQAYIEGFVKKASEYGFDENQAMDLLKTAGNGRLARNIIAGIFKTPRKTIGAIGGAAGGLVGGGIGGAIGGVNGLINPGQEIDPETGQLVDKSRIMSALKGGLKGTAVGGALGGGIGAVKGMSGAKNFIKELKTARRASPELKTALKDIFAKARLI